MSHLIAPAKTFHAEIDFYLQQHGSESCTEGLTPCELPPPAVRDTVTQDLRECAEPEGVSTNLGQRKPPSKANITHMLVPEMTSVLHQPEPLKCS